MTEGDSLGGVSPDKIEKNKADLKNEGAATEARSLDAEAEIKENKTEDRSTKGLKEEQRADKEEKEAVELRLLDFEIERMILENAVKINEGNNGVIYSINFGELTEEVKEKIQNLGIETDGSQAIKLLKVYQEGEGKREYEIHERAHKILGRDSRKFAIAPEPVLFRDIEISDETRELLNADGIRSKGRVEVIFMELIDGMDLAEITAREALWRAMPDQYKDFKEASKLPLAEVYAELRGKRDANGQELQIHSPGGKSRDEGAREYERRKVNNENAASIYRFLRSFGFVMDKKILERLASSVEKLHTAGIAHRDLHERNIMIVGSYERSAEDLAENTVYIIDFGAAQEFSGSYRGANALEKMYTGEDGVKRDQDEVALRRLRPLTLTQEEENEIKRMAGVAEIFEPVEKLRKKKEWLAKRDRYIAEHLSGADVDYVEKIKLLARTYLFNKEKIQHRKISDLKIAYFTDFISTLFERGYLDQEFLIEQLEALKKEKKSTNILTEDARIDRYYDDLIKYIKNAPASGATGDR